MRIFCLMQVGSSLVGSVSTESLRISPSSSDDVSSFKIKSLRIIGEFAFLALIQSRLNRVDLSFSLHAMTLKIFLVDFFETSVAVWVRNCMHICVGCTDFAHVFIHLCEM